MKHTLSILALCTLAACGGGGGGSGGAFIPPASSTTPDTSTASAAPPPAQPASQPPAAPSPVSPCSMAYWGDSISALTVGRIKGFAIQKQSVTGGTAQSALPLFLQDPMAVRFVVLEYGTNEANGGTAYEPAMRSMLDRIKAVGRTPVVVGLSQGTAGDVVAHAMNNALAAQLAKDYGALFVDWGAVPYYGASDLMPDGVHPGDAYAQRLADRLTAVLVGAAPECAGTN